MATTLEFFDAMFGDSEGLISIFQLPSKKSVFLSEPSEATEHCDSQGVMEDVYFGVGAYDAVSQGRGKASNVKEIVSLWADVDYGDTHSKSRTPKTRADALSILSQAPLPPSVIVHSGYGFHAYWLLKEPLETGEGAANYARRWVDTMQAIADKMGFVIDPVGDIARVLRVPGTTNHKHGKHVEVEIEKFDANIRYTTDDIDKYLIEEPDRSGKPSDNGQAVTSSVVVGNVKIDPAATVDHDKLEAMKSADQRFEKTWEKSRLDMKDDSPSAYEMSLANCGYAAMWSDQEVADMVIAWGRKHGLNRMHKYRRASYMNSLLTKAKMNQRHVEALEELSLATPMLTSRNAMSPEEIDGIIDTISHALGVEMIRWIQHGMEDASYSLILADKRDVLIGGVASVTNQRTFRNAVYQATGNLPIQVKQPVWDNICMNLAKIAEIILADEVSRQGRLREWVDQYIETNCRGEVEDNDQLRPILQRLRPYLKDGMVFINAGNLTKYVRYSLGEIVKRRDVLSMLRVSGWDRKNVSSRADGKVITKGYWCSTVENATTFTEEEIEENAENLPDDEAEPATEAL